MSSGIRIELEGLTRDQLTDRIVEMKSEIVKAREDYARIIDLRLYHLERSQNLYMRRESFEIASIPTNIKYEDLEDEVIDIAREAKVMVNKKVIFLQPTDLKNRKTVIVRLVNREYSTQAIINGKN